MPDQYTQTPATAATSAGFTNERLKDMGDGTFARVTATKIADGDLTSIGATTDAEAPSGNGSVIALLKRLRTLLAGGLPAALGQGSAAQSLGVVPAGADTTLQSAATGTGNGTVADVSGLASVFVQIVGITVATITWEGTVDGTNWIAVPLHNANTGLVATTATADGLYSRRVAGLKQLRARISAYTSGTITATAHGIAAGDAGHVPALLLGKSTTLGDTAVKLDSAGRVPVATTAAVGDGLASNAALMTTPGDTNNSAPLAVLPYLFNGSTWDREAGNIEGTALASAARTTTADSADFVNANGRGLAVYLNVTVASGTGGLTVKLQAKDPVSGNYKTVSQATAAVIATGLAMYGFYPGIATFGTEAKNTSLARTWRIEIGVGDASSYTYSVGYCILQ